MMCTHWPKKLPEPPQIWFYCLATGNKEDGYLNKRQIVLQKKKKRTKNKLKQIIGYYIISLICGVSKS